jgi:hypothetical protein
MSTRNIIIIAACGVVVIVGLVLGLTLGKSDSGQTPGKKVMADTRAYLMEMQRLLNGRGELAEPELCACCDTPMVNGECPYCKGSCDQSAAAGLERFNIVSNAPVTEVEGGGEAAAASSGGGGCSCD